MNKAPFTGKIVSTKRIVGPEATGETCDIVIDHGGNMPYWEGQSYGVIPPGTNPKNGKPNSVRLYSIAASRYGDDMSGKQTTLCVRRATYWCPELGAEDPAKKGVCSNFLCDAKLGDDELQEILKNYPDQFRVDYALSREQTNAKGGKMYIQDKVEEYGDEIFDLLDGGAHMYFCGLKGMMPGILTMLEGVAKAKGLEWDEFLEKVKKNGQWHVEVY